MRTLEYNLLPEAYGSKGNFVSKKGTPAELIFDTGMLLLDFQKVIPTLDIVNRLFLKGDYPRAGEWEPFEINNDEYLELVERLTSLQLARPYRTS
ncbi:hypothetical protein [Peribacillus alkalitolerans]|uniref:hypothetical protein n=1 Tax=Peribacillus alkalitolerans TaxID=1550385 RepID=UPI0013D305BD|nr:hypothetical protein [Peribacillus alkalitolerans]